MLQSDENRIFTVKHTTYKIIGWVNLLLFTFATIMSWRANTGYIPLIFLFFALLGLYIVLASGHMEVDSKSIRFYSHFGKYKINWDEIKYIEIDKQLGNIVFFGDEKVLQTIGLQGWTGKKEKLEMADFLFEQIENRKIEIRQTEKAMFRLSKNTKIKS